MAVLVWLSVGALFAALTFALKYKRLVAGIPGVQSSFYSVMGVRPSPRAVLVMAAIVAIFLWPAALVIQVASILKK